MSVDILLEGLKASLLCLLLVLFVRFMIGGYLFGGCGSALLGSVFSALLGVYLCWHSGMSGIQGISFSPFWGLIPVLLAETYTYLQTLFKLKRDSVSHSGDRYVLPDGVVIRLPMTAPVSALVTGLIEALILWRSGTVTIRLGLVTFFRYPVVRWVLFASGAFVILSLLGLMRRVAALPSKR
jgi:hypothetical protein